MLELKRLLKDPEGAHAALSTRGAAGALAEIIALANRRREVVSAFNELRHKQKTVSQDFAKKDPTDEARWPKRRPQGACRGQQLDSETKLLDKKLEDALLQVPNIPAPGVPEGKSEDQNVVKKTWAKPQRSILSRENMMSSAKRLASWTSSPHARSRGPASPCIAASGRSSREPQRFMLDIHDQMPC